MKWVGDDDLSMVETYCDYLYFDEKS